MKWLLGTFSQGWNARRSRRGHVFQGRYKSVPVSAATDSPHYFRIAADYIHLNPARAGLAGGSSGKLTSYKWSSLPDYARGQGPDWLVMERVWNAFELSAEARGRKAYIDWLEKRAANNAGEIDEEAMKALRRGWYLGEPGFLDQLRSLVKPERKRKGGGDSVARQHDVNGVRFFTLTFSLMKFAHPAFSFHAKSAATSVSGGGLPRDGAWGRRQGDF
jgi:hypothetical protein